MIGTRSRKAFGRRDEVVRPVLCIRRTRPNDRVGECDVVSLGAEAVVVGTRLRRDLATTFAHRAILHSPPMGKALAWKQHAGEWHGAARPLVWRPPAQWRDWQEQVEELQLHCAREARVATAVRSRCGQVLRNSQLSLRA